MFLLFTNKQINGRRISGIAGFPGVLLEFSPFTAFAQLKFLERTDQRPEQARFDLNAFSQGTGGRWARLCSK